MNTMNNAERKFSEINYIISGNTHYPVFNTISGSKISFWGRGHGTVTHNSKSDENIYTAISKAILNEEVSMDNIAVATAINISFEKYNELINNTTIEERAKLAYEYNKETLSLMCTDGKVSNLFDNPFKYSSDDIINDYHIVIMGCIDNHVNENLISHIMCHKPIKTKKIGHFYYERKDKPQPSRRDIIKYTYNLFGKSIHLITGFNVFGGANKSDHKNMKINGKDINIYK